ncbi:MAG: pyrroline-5-carboxylate reductase [Desulfobacterales bacterium]
MSDDLLDGKRIGFIGAGNMAEAIGRGLIYSGAVEAGRMIASDPAETRRVHMTESYGIRTTDDNNQVVDEADIVILAVKPQVIPNVLGGIGPSTGADKLVISIVAGLTVDAMKTYFTGGARVIRTIPNTPVFVQEGMVALASGQTANEADYAAAEAIFKPVARTVVIEEKLMDAALGVSGSGPAYAFVMIEALADGGVRMGLPRQVAVELAAQTLLGAAKMCLESELHTGQLKDMVTSPGGTTIAALYEMERLGVRGALMAAVEAAARRSEELGRMS